MPPITDRSALTRWLWVGLISALALLVVAMSARAQDQGAKSDLEKQYDQAFQAMFEDPANLDKAFSYARLAIQMRDFEGAISTPGNSMRM